MSTLPYCLAFKVFSGKESVVHVWCEVCPPFSVFLEKYFHQVLEQMISEQENLMNSEQQQSSYTRKPQSHTSILTESTNKSSEKENLCESRRSLLPLSLFVSRELSSSLAETATLTGEGDVGDVRSVGGDAGGDGRGVGGNAGGDGRGETGEGGMIRPQPSLPFDVVDGK